MSRKYYIPFNDAKFLEWVRALIAYVIANAERFGMLPPDAMISELTEQFALCVQKCADPNHGRIDTINKNDVRRKLEKAARELVQGHLAKNPKVNNADREAMGLTVYDKTPTTVAVPSGQAIAAITYPGRTQLLLTVEHDNSTPTDHKAEHGCRIYYRLCEYGETPPSVKQLNESRFARHKKVKFSFEPEDSGKTAYFAIRYENGKGEMGPWGQVFSAIVQ
jgi:hypothetical protein